jgi:transposase
MTALTIEVELPPGLTITAYERYGDGHGFEIAWPLPERCRCDRCCKEEPARLEYRDRPQVVRDLDLWGEPSFWVYQPPVHRCPWCNHRQFLLPPFKRPDTKYTYRFEQHVLRSLIGSNEEEVARRLGIAAETVARIARNQLADGKAKQVDPVRVIKDLGIDELSLKKRHKLYVTLLTDLTNPERPEILAVAPGRDEAAARTCLEKLSPEQRKQVQAYRADRGPAFHAACKNLLPNAKPVVDRFHVAKLFNEAIDGQRKKNHAGVQGETVEGRAESVSLLDVGVPPRPEGPDGGGEAALGGTFPGAAPTAPPLRAAGAVQGDL